MCPVMCTGDPNRNGEPMCWGDIMPSIADSVQVKLQLNSLVVNVFKLILGKLT